MQSMSFGARIRRRMRRRRRAQGMTEYIIIVGLIAILLIGAVTTFKDSLKGAFDKGAEKITSDITDKMDDPAGGGGTAAPPPGG